MKFSNYLSSHVWLLIVYISFCLIILGCSNEPKSSAKITQLPLRFNEAFVIGENEPDSVKYYFSSPTEVKTDNAGNIYIADRETSNIRVFDENGTYVRSIGGAGKGPGEFESIATFHINDQNQLIVFDGVNQRITRFSNKGEVMSTYVPDKGEMIWPDDIRRLNNNRYLLIKNLRDRNADNQNPAEYHSKVLHIYDDSIEQRITSFGRIDTLVNTESGFVNQFIHITGNAGYFFTTANNSVWYVPKLYNGELFKFKRQSNIWQRSSTANGDVVPQKPVKINSEAKGAVYINTYTPEGRQTVNGKIQSESLGLFQLRDGRVVHFSAQIQDTQRVTRVEVFNKSGELQGLGQLAKFSFSGESRGAEIAAIWKDDSDRFYIIDMRDNPVVRVGKIEGLNR